jgi:hypothetical protein
MGFEERCHSPNEHFGIFNYLKGIETIPLFYKYFVELNKRTPHQPTKSVQK